ncbi:MAG: nitrous oxide reductase accessory protein NosL [Calditrichaceae bacterium]
MKKIKIIILSLLLVVFVSEAADQNPKMPGEKDRCPVCAMFVHPYPKWIAEMIYADGMVKFFDGPKDMFKYFLHPEKYGGSAEQKPVKIYVREYYELQWVEADSAFFVIDSDILGPMGNELVPLKTKTDAEEFREDHQGSKMLKFDEVTWDLLMRLSVGQEM